MHLIKLTLLLLIFTGSAKSNCTSLDTIPHYPIIDSLGIDYNLELKLYNLSKNSLQHEQLAWWDKSVLYTNYFSSAVKLFFPLNQLKEIWLQGYEVDPHSSCQNVEMEFARIDNVEYNKGIPFPIHCVLMRETTFFKTKCSSLYEKYDSVLITKISQFRTNENALIGKQKELDEIMKFQIRYPGRSVVGINLESVAWSVIQSGDLPYLSKYIDLLKLAVKCGDLHPRYLAASLDRIEILNNRPQIYGTQTKTSEKEREVYPIKDIKKVNELRAQMGLGILDTSNTSLGDLIKSEKINK